MELSIAQYLSCSAANGPGKRCVIWFQGCEKTCPNCCNPQFQTFKENNTIIEELVEKIKEDHEKYDLRGITLTGGEPLLQLEAIQKMVKNARNFIEFDVLVFSGANASEIAKNRQLLTIFDLIIAGPYIPELRKEKGIVSSTNQEIVRLTNRFNDVSDDELINGERIIEVHNIEGGIVVSGLISGGELWNTDS